MGTALSRLARFRRHSGMVPPGPRKARPDDMLRTRPQMRNCASGNLEIPGSMLSHRPGIVPDKRARSGGANRVSDIDELRELTCAQQVTLVQIDNA